MYCSITDSRAAQWLNRDSRLASRFVMCHRERFCYAYTYLALILTVLFVLSLITCGIRMYEIAKKLRSWMYTSLRALIMRSEWYIVFTWATFTYARPSVCISKNGVEFESLENFSVFIWQLFEWATMEILIGIKRNAMECKC